MKISSQSLPKIANWLCPILAAGLIFAACQPKNPNENSPVVAAPKFENLSDSLAHLLATHPQQDSHRVNFLNDLAWEIMFDDPARGEKHVREALKISQKINFPKGEADALNRLGVLAETESRFAEAENFYKKSMEIRQRLGDLRGMASLQNNLGNLFEGQADYVLALQHLSESLNLCEQLKDSAKIARAHYNLGQVYEQIGAYDEAFQHINDFRFFVETGRDSTGMALAYRMLGHIRYELEMFLPAKDWYEKSLALREKLADTTETAAALTDLANLLDEIDSTEKAITFYNRAVDFYRKTNDSEGIANALNGLGDAKKHLKQFNAALINLREAIAINKSIDNKAGLVEVYNTVGDVYFGLKNLDKAIEFTDLYFQLAKEIDDEKFVQKGYKDYAKLYAAKGDFKKAFKYRVQYDELRYTRLDENRTKTFERKEVLFSDKKIKQDNDKKQREIERQEAQLAKNRATRNALLGGAAALSLLILLLYNRNRLRAKANRELAQKNIAIEAERQRADGLLKNILPAATAEELKRNNAVRPEKYESVTVMFTDFKSFTTIAERMPPEDLVAELDECFRVFDEIVGRHGIEKIKTIGDAYMCVGGLPIRNDTHAADVVAAALEMQAALKKLTEPKRLAGLPFFEMRVGVHTGAVVAGVVGAKKFAYDIWGDTVNTAARMESASEPGRVNISETTFKLVCDKFHCTFRGKLPAKNKGEIEMYWVDFT